VSFRAETDGAASGERAGEDEGHGNITLFNKHILGLLIEIITTIWYMLHLPILSMDFKFHLQEYWDMHW